MSDQIICNCFQVSKSTIVEAVKNGADTLDKVMEETGAAKGCGTCADQITQIVAEVLAD